MTKKSVLLLLSVILLSIGLQSCFSLDTEKEYLGDIYIASKIVGSDTLYAIEAYVSANDIMTQVTMTYPDGTTSVDLTKFTSGYYEYAGSDSAFTLQKPQTGKYSFSITFEDETAITTTDYLFDTIAKYVTIESAELAEDGGYATIEWKQNSDANAYVIKIMKSDDVLFSGTLDSSDSIATIYTYSYGWASGANPSTGDSLDVVVAGIILDYSDSEYTKYQSISQSARAPIVWVE